MLRSEPRTFVLANLVHSWIAVGSEARVDRDTGSRRLQPQGLEAAAIVKGIRGPFAGRSAADDMTVVVARHASSGRDASPD